MELEIIVFKDSGKFYDGCTVDCPEDIKLHEDRFFEFIDNHLPSHIGSGFVYVKDTNKYPQQSFHTKLFRYHEIMNRKCDQYD